jgi:hypothetical protein
METYESVTTRTDRWYDPIVVGAAVAMLVPFFVYGMVVGWLRDLRNGPHPPCKQTQRGCTDEEIRQLREAWLQKYGTLP